MDRKLVLETEGAMGDGWDFCSTQKKDIKILNSSSTSASKSVLQFRTQTHQQDQ